MAEVCAVAVMTGYAENAQPMTMRVAEKGSCIPTWGVEQELASGISPLGSGHQGCVKLNQNWSSLMLKVNINYEVDQLKSIQIKCLLIAAC